MTNEVPHLTTALTGPLLALEKQLLSKQTEIEAWFRERWQEVAPPITSSVDLRNAGYKLAPIDTNLFPAGFNNLNPEFMPLCIQAIQFTMHHYYPQCQRILILAESHTRNVFYFESIAVLQEILQKAGYEVRIGTLLEELQSKKSVKLPTGRSVEITPLTRKDDHLVTIDDFDPCLIILNNDLSAGVPEILQGLTQIIRSPLEMSWSFRLKSTHFTHYQAVAEEFGRLIDIDPWLINPLFRVCGDIDFMAHEGETCIMRHVDILLEAIQKKYDEYNITEKPFIIVKADSGTYGMGVMTIHEAQEIKELNRKQRKKMGAGKGSMKITQVIIQEGVPTFETIGENKAFAEPVIYMLGRSVVGGFYRVHSGRSQHDNLNAPGMEFEPLAFATPCNNPDANLDCHETVNRFYAYGVIGRLASLAAAYEIAEVLK